MKKLMLAMTFIVACLTPACGGDEFSAEQGGSSGTGGAAGASGSSGSGGTTATGGSSGSSGSGGSSGTGGASADAGEEDAAEDAAPDTADAADAAEADAAEEPDAADAEICPDGGILSGGPVDCGQPPATGLAICIVLAHDATCGFIGAAGGNPPQGQAVDPYYNDPMIVVGGPCMATAAGQDTVLCQSPAPKSTLVQFAPGLHGSANGPTVPGRYACDGQACRGKVFVYKDGAVVGSLQNGTASGILKLVAYKGRLDLSFIAP